MFIENAVKIKRVIIGVSCFLIVGCDFYHDRSTSSSDQEISSIAVDVGHFPSRMTYAYLKVKNPKCPSSNLLRDFSTFSEYFSQDKTLGLLHVDYMVCLDSVGARERALLEAHRILQVSAHLSGQYDRDSIAYAASFLAEEPVGTAIDTAVGSFKLLELDVAPFPSTATDHDFRKIKTEQNSKMFLEIYLKK